MGRWKETIYTCPQLSDGGPLRLFSAGITHPDNTYRISRSESNGMYVLGYVIRGRGQVTCGDQHFTPEAGDVYFLQPEVAEEYHSDPDDPWEKIWFNLQGPLMDALCDAYSLRGLFYFRDCPLQTEFFRALEIVRDWRSDSAARLAIGVHTILGRLYEWRKNHPELRKSPEGICLKEYLDRHWQRKFSLRELAGQIRKSPAQTLRIFQRDWHDTPNGYLQKQRLFFACQYLENTDDPVKVLAGVMGFKDEFYFSNWFKQRKGVSPSQYRKSFR